MDDTDRKIIDLLRRDALMSLAALGKIVDLAPSSVHERVRKLRESGLIRRFTVDLDPDLAGYPILAFIGIRIDKPANTAGFVKFAVRQHEVLECHHVSGVWNFLLKVRVRSTANLEDLLTRRFKKLKGFAGSETMVALYAHKETHDLGPL
jgi:Lrp/AsnC family transcriptional regulator, leucine-responsive regulatory protein